MPVAVPPAVERKVLGYRPRYNSLDAIRDGLRWLVAKGHVDLGGRTV